jgi:hypothetical protein
LLSAKAGDPTAINFLFLALQSTVSKAFWRFVGNNPSFQRQRIQGGDQGTVAAMVFEALHKAAYRMGKPSDDETVHAELMSGVSPLSLFDPTKFSSSTNLIERFAYYLRAALTNDTRKENETRSRNGVTGKMDKKAADDIKGSVSIDAYEDPDHDLAHSAMSADYARVEDLDAWEDFADDLSLDQGKGPTPRELLKFLLNMDKGFSAGSVDKAFKVFSAKYGIKHRNTISNRLTIVGEVLAKHGITQEALVQLLTSVGGVELAKTL